MSSILYNKIGSLTLYILLTFTMTCMLTENEAVTIRYICICQYDGCSRKSIFRANDREKTREKERRVKSPLFFFFLCTSLVVVVPPVPSQGSDESSKNFVITSLSILFFLLSSRNTARVCVLNKE